MSFWKGKVETKYNKNPGVSAENSHCVVHPVVLLGKHEHSLPGEQNEAPVQDSNSFSHRHHVLTREKWRQPTEGKHHSIVIRPSQKGHYLVKSHNYFPILSFGLENVYKKALGPEALKSEAGTFTSQDPEQNIQ